MFFFVKHASLLRHWALHVVTNDVDCCETMTVALISLATMGL